MYKEVLKCWGVEVAVHAKIVRSSNMLRAASWLPRGVNGYTNTPMIQNQYLMPQNCNATDQNKLSFAKLSNSASPRSTKISKHTYYITSST